MAVLLAIAVVVFYGLYRRSSNEIEKSALLPVIDFTGMEPQVAEKIRRLLQETQIHPESAAVWGKLGMTLDVHGLNEESIRCYQRAAELDPKDFRWTYYCAIALKENGSSEALSWFQKGSSLKPDYAPQYVRYGRALFQAGKLKESESRFQQALQLDSNSAESCVGLAQIAISRNEIQTAREFAEKAIQLNPKQGEAYNLLALLYRRMQDSAAAARALAKSQELPEKSSPVDPVYSALVSEGESAFWYRTRGRTYMDAGLYLLAVREFKTALQLQADADAYDNLGVALQGLGRWEEAVTHHKKAIAMNPGYLKFYNLGIAYGKMGNYKEAIEAFQSSIRWKPDYAESYYNLGVAYYKLMHWPDAIENLKLAVQKHPNHARAHLALGLAYLAKGERILARKQYEILRELDPELAKKMK